MSTDEDHKGFSPTQLFVSSSSSSNYHITCPVLAHDSNTSVQMVIQCYPLQILVILITNLICVQDHWPQKDKLLLLKQMFD